jgi:farnesyl-diphosphate farnesyltransferase
MSIVCQSCERERERERKDARLFSPLVSGSFLFVFLVAFYSLGLHFVVGYFSFVYRKIAEMGLVEVLLKHPEELPALVKLKIAAMQASRAIPADPDLAFCYKLLTRVSRSFSIVIQQLGPELRDAVCVFYVVLRGLDTVEDDMSIPIEVKVPILKDFHKTIYDPSWHFSCGVKDYKELMDKFGFVSNAFLGLSKGYQDVIAEMTQRMGAGMAKFIESEVETVEDYDEYCHYVAGIVGIGLSRLFHSSGLEALAPDSLSNSMGLFLQKLNIVRDYLEDINEIPAPRMFWPREIWGRYAARLEDFKQEENSEKAVQCLNAMVTNGLSHATDCLQYLSAVNDPSNLRFCAIPQIMAIASYAMCYNNIEVFRGVVKIRRGLTAKVFETRSMSDVCEGFYKFSSILASKIDNNDPSAAATQKYIDDIQAACEPYIFQKEKFSGFEYFMFLIIFLLLGVMVFLLWREW